MICTLCEQEMTLGVSCKAEDIDFADDTTLAPVPNGDQVCHDCQTPAGGIHHPGCDMERCPRCKGQLISCGCLGE